MEGLLFWEYKLDIIKNLLSDEEIEKLLDDVEIGIDNT